MQSILSFGAHAFPDVPSRNCPKSQCSSWRFAPVPPVRTGRGYGVDTGPLPAAGAAWSGAAQDAVTGGGRRAWKADCTQRPYTRLRGSAGAGWSGAARDDVAGGCGGGADSDCAQRPYTRLRRSAGAGWSGAARDDVAGGCGGARIRTARNDPIRGCMGRPGRDGRGPRGTARQAVAAGRGMRTARNDPIRGCAGRRAAMVGGRVGRRGRPWGGARNADCVQRPYMGYAAGPRRNWGGASRKAWLSALASHGMRTSSRPYTRVCGSTGPRYWGPLRRAGPAVVARRRMQVSRNDPIHGHPRRAGGQNGLVPGPLARGVGYRFSTLRSRVGDGWRSSEKLRRARMPHNVVRWRELRAIPPPRRPTIRRRAPVARSQRSAGHGRDADARGMVASGRRMCRSAEPGPRRPRPPRRRLRRRCP